MSDKWKYSEKSKHFRILLFMASKQALEKHFLYFLTIENFIFKKQMKKPHKLIVMGLLLWKCFIIIIFLFVLFHSELWEKSNTISVKQDTVISLYFILFLTASLSTPLKCVFQIPWHSFALAVANSFDRSGKLRNKEFWVSWLSF